MDKPRRHTLGRVAAAAKALRKRSTIYQRKDERARKQGLVGTRGVRARLALFWAWSEPQTILISLATRPWSLS